MGAPVFFVETAELHAGPAVVLDGAEGHHAATVRRLRIGEPVLLTDGLGVRAEGVVAAVARDRVDIQVSSLVATPLPQPRVVVVQALPKGDRGELAVATMTEVGVDAIVPWAASRCVARWEGSRGARSLEKWRTTAREAAKQSRRFWFPTVADLASTAAVAELIGAAAAAVVLHEEAGALVSGVEPPVMGDLVLVVGPEGGVSPGELEQFAAAGGLACRLGPTVLRTSTAGAVASAVLLSRTARWAVSQDPGADGQPAAQR